MKPSLDLDPAGFVGQALRVLKGLAGSGTRLERRGEVYALTGTGRAGRALHVPKSTVDALRRRGWVQPTGGDEFAISTPGLGWLKRTLAGEDPAAAQRGLRAQREMTYPDGERVVVTVNDAESPLARLHTQTGPDGKPLIDDTQYLAGDRLRRDFTLGNLEPRLGIDLTAPVVSGRRGASHDAFSDITIAARQRYARAMAALGPGLADIAAEVCCHLKEPDDASAAHGWSPTEKLFALKLALDRLVEHYGLIATGRGYRTRAWQAPELDDGEVAHAKTK